MNEARVVNRRVEPYDIYIGRGSEWGNQFSHLSSRYPDVVRVDSRAEAIERYRIELWRRVGREGMPLIRALASLNGRTLGCYCKPSPCHGDVLVRAAIWARNEVRRREAETR